MRRLFFAAVAIGVSWVLLFATGCGSSSTAHLRLLNAIPIQSNLDMLIDTKNVASAIAYGSASGYVSVSSGSRHLQIEPTGTTSPIVDQNVSISSGSFSTVLESSSGPLVLTDDNTTPSSGNIKVRVINASSNIGTADVYIVSSGAGIGSASPTFSNVAFPSASGYSTVAAGSYQVILTFPGTTSVKLSTGSMSFNSGQVRTIVVMDGQTGGLTSSVLSDAN
jgi:hypothetical protein